MCNREQMKTSIAEDSVLSCFCLSGDYEKLHLDPQYEV